MSYKGDQIAHAISQHMAGGALDGIANTLLTRPLGEKHFAAAKTFMQGTLDAAKEKIHWRLHDNADARPAIPLSKRQMELYLMYMAVNKNDHGEYAPAVHRTLVSQNSAMFFDRLLPVRLYAQYLEYKHVKRATEALDYQDDPFKCALAFSLLLTRALEGQMPAGYDKTVPVVVPQPEGMFLGYARRAHPTSYHHTNCLYAIYNEQNGRGKTMQVLPEWTPAFDITIKTYIHRRDFLGGQPMLHRKLCAFMEDPAHAAAMSRFVDGYAIGQLDSLFTDAEKRNLDVTLQDLTEITRGHSWGTAVRKATANFVRKELN